MNFRQFRILLLCFVPLFQVSAQDTLRISIREADSIFLAGNYRLLAADMNIRSQEARVIQARLYPNPVLTADFNAYDPQNDIPLHVGSSGQKFMQLEQLVLLGGKRRKEIALAKTNSKIASLEFQDLVRQLKFQLHSSLYAINQQLFLLNKYNTQLRLLDTLLGAYEVQVKKGNIAMKDLVRLKGVYLNLGNDRAELMQYYLGELSKVQTILQLSSNIIPVISDADLQSRIKTFALGDLQSTALANRPDYLIAEQDQVAAEQYYRLQKSMAIPDVTLYANYDQRSGAFNNQLNAGISIPIPGWNRNQGNIKSAQYQIKEQEYNNASLKNEILVTLQNQLYIYNHTIEEYRKASSLYNEAFDATFKSMNENFAKQNVSVIEFTDFFESYNNSLSEIVRINIQLAVSAEQLNLTIGKELF